MLETVRTPRAVSISPERAALKAVLVSVRMLVVMSAKKLAVSSSRFVQVIICSILEGIWLEQIIIEISGQVYLQNGVGR